MVLGKNEKTETEGERKKKKRKRERLIFLIYGHFC